ncbi:MAG: AAA family ATPase [Gammaproteobacteria bacterium]|nr:AAA family ATPase [Gammaproteobacteria bacterium]
MIEAINLLRNIGTFDSVDSGAHLPLQKVALIYAENGRGKTTLASTFRSLSSGDPLPVTERHRLGAQHPPHIVISSGAGQSVFENGAWNQPLPTIVVFDDEFVAQNVCSGMKVEAGHKQKLHELIIGARGVQLNAALQLHVDRIEQHNRDLQAKGAEIPADAREGLTVDAFCALEEQDDIDEAVQEAERALAAGRKADAIRQHPLFLTIALPRFDVDAIQELLARDLPGLEANAAARVQTHLAKLGHAGEVWVGEGMSRIANASEGEESEVCPFCAQPLDGSVLIAHYQEYFSDAYRELREAIDDMVREISNIHSGEIQAAFERSVRVAGETRQFWSEFLALPEIGLDTAAIFRSWKGALEAVQELLSRKQAAPLEPLAIDGALADALATYHDICAEVKALSERLAATHEQIEIVRERAAAADIDVLQADLNTLSAIRNRRRPEIAALCDAYLEEKRLKSETEQARDTAREALNVYRNEVFPTYGEAINDYLRRFNAHFRLHNVTSVNIRGGSSCNYSVLVNQVAVPLQGDAGEPSFRNTLSAGDRNTLALAFFFASLENDPTRAQKVVVIDDPITSLDEHRSLTTIQEMRRLADAVEQIIVLSHTKPFLCDIWQGTATTLRSACRIVRAGEGSTIAAWDVNQDCVTEHDRNHAMVLAYVQNGAGDNERAIASALRPIMEAFMRVGYPEDFPPGSLLGPFIGVCEQREGSPQQILSPADRQEVRDLLDYANLFHHDTNAAFQTVTINDHELLQFAQRVLAFARR